MRGDVQGDPFDTQLWGQLRNLAFSTRVALVLAATVPPLWIAVTLASPARIHRIVRQWARVAVALCGCHVRVAGLGNLPKPSGVVMVANHSSFLDSVILIAAIPGEYRFVANHLAAGRPVLGAIIQKSGHVVVNRASAVSRASCARSMVSLLESGTSLMLFPEGSRSRGRLLPFHIGAFKVASRTSRPVVPIAIAGTGQMFPPKARLLQKTPVSVNVLAPIESRTGPGEAATLRDAAFAAIATQVGSAGQ